MTFAFENFEVKELLTTRYSNDRNVLSRLRNSLITGLNSYSQMPRLIVVVLDDDIVRYVDSKHKDDVVLSVEIGKITEWLAREFERAILSYRDYLPSKAKRDYFGHVLWIAPPTHKFFGRSSNLKRERQSSCLNTVVKFRQNMSCLRMLKIWEHDDANSFVHDSYRFTSEGLARYWLSIDSAIRFWNVAIAPKLGVVKQKQKAKVPGKFKKDRFRWRKDERN